MPGTAITADGSPDSSSKAVNAIEPLKYIMLLKINILKLYLKFY
jgi:hypothetical protein